MIPATSPNTIGIAIIEDRAQLPVIIDQPEVKTSETVEKAFAKLVISFYSFHLINL